MLGYPKYLLAGMRYFVSDHSTLRHHHVRCWRSLGPVAVDDDEGDGTGHCDSEEQWNSPGNW